MAVKLNGAPDGQREENKMYLAYQQVLVQKEESRWVVTELGELELIEARDASMLWGVEELPAYTYTGTAANFQVKVFFQKSLVVNNTVQTSSSSSWFFGPTSAFDTVPKPGAEFDEVYHTQWSQCIFLGSQEDKAAITRLGLSVAPMDDGQERPALQPLSKGSGGGSSSSGESWSSQTLDPDWGPIVSMAGGGSGGHISTDNFLPPDSFAADLYINGEKVAELTLRPEEGGAQ